MGTALITGASAGLGEEFAWQLAAAGHHLVLVARREDRLTALAERIHNVAGVHVEALPADLSDDDDVAQVVRRLVSDEPRPIGLLVNNAGFGLTQRFLDSTIAEELDALDVMVRAVLELSHAAGRAMVGRGHGAILNVSSMTQNTAMGTYAAHKAWVRAFTEALATELEGTGVSATAVLPGLTHTEFHAVAHMDETAWPRLAWLNAEQVVEAALAAVRHGDVLCVPSLRYRAAHVLLHAAPRRIVRAVTGAQSHSRSRR